MHKKLSFFVLFSFFILSCVSTAYGLTGFFTSHEKVKAINGEVILPLKSISDGKAHHFVYKSEDKAIKFFVIQSGDGVIRAAFDACDVCFHSKKGYSQDGEFMICNNCGRKFHSSRINVVQGGCNPAPLKRVTEGDKLVIQVSDILHGARYF